MIEYTICVSKSQGGAIPLALVATSMAKNIATQAGTTPLHRATFELTLPTNVSILLKAARAGELAVCNECGVSQIADEVIVGTDKKSSRMSVSYLDGTINLDATHLSYLFTTEQFLKEWGQRTFQKFNFTYALEEQKCGDVPNPQQSESSETFPIEIGDLAIKTHAENGIADLFDPVSIAALEKMFPSANQWRKYADRAARNGLVEARVDRRKFNPYLAAVWWFGRKQPEGWDWARCMRVLANNLPARSVDCKSRLTGVLD
jgi:hypothetical protein